MVQATRLTLAALVLCAAFAAPAVAASRQLKQAGGTIEFPGCSFLSDSEIAQNEDFSSLFTALQTVGLNETLANLTTPHTLFAPTNDAFADFLEAANVTIEDAPETVYDVLTYHVVPANVEELLTDMDVIVLPTLLESANLTIMTDEVNSTEVVTVVSDGSEATVVTPAAYACNLVIYGIDGVLVPEEVLFDSDSPTSNLPGTLSPSSADVPSRRLLVDSRDS